MDCHDRVHFFALAAQVMRRVLVDAARARTALKRGGASRGRPSTHRPSIWTAFRRIGSNAAISLCALHDALETLAQIDPRRAKVIELRFFGGLSVDETAEVLGVSPQTVMRDWRLARAWLARELRGDETRPVNDSARFAVAAPPLPAPRGLDAALAGVHVQNSMRMPN